MAPLDVLNKDLTTRFEASAWKRDIPYSRPPMPDTPRNILKYAFWYFYTPIHPFMRDAVLALGIMRQKPTGEDPTRLGRQKFLIGRMAPGKSAKDVSDRLVSRGYGNHFVAWIDDGEVVSLRKLDGFSHQYHVRVFDDGEVRGHYEYTPEYSPVMHYKAVGLSDRTGEFLALLEGLVVPA